MPNARRRVCLQWAGAACLGPAASMLAQAGTQAEEPLADAVRTALSASIANSAPPRPNFSRIEERLAYLRWLGAMSDKLKARKAERQTRIEFLETLWYESKRASLQPELVLGLMQVESGFRKYARLIGDGSVARLFHMQTNLRFGCVILRHYLEREQGDLFMALGRYNGSRGRSEYPDAVLGARRQWMTV